MPTPNLGLRLSIAAGKAATLLSRSVGRGGTALPGLVVERLHPTAIEDIAEQCDRGVILVTGTNGKTTTASMLTSMLRQAGLRVIHNASGSNLARGITAAFVAAAESDGTLRNQSRTAAVIEVDEAVMPLIAKRIRPRAVVFNNLFRDQLDRYGELDSVAGKWQTAIEGMPDATLIINGDDPLLATLPVPSEGRRVYFGLDDDAAAGEAGQTADSIWCGVCRSRLHYDAVWFGHMGRYRCLHCGWHRPDLNVRATSIDQNQDGVTIDVDANGHQTTIRIAAPGVFNVYNALAAFATAGVIGVPTLFAVEALESFSPAFGRAEQFQIEKTHITMLLVKNPTGCDQAIRTVLELDPMPNLLLALNDGIQDGQDVSWIWDVEFERLAGRARRVIVTGERGADMALRMRYAGIEAELVPDEAEAVARTLTLDRVFVLPTYTAMMSLRAGLAARSGKAGFWVDA